MGKSGATNDAGASGFPQQPLRKRDCIFGGSPNELSPVRFWTCQSKNRFEQNRPGKIDLAKSTSAKTTWPPARVSSSAPPRDIEFDRRTLWRRQFDIRRARAWIGHALHLGLEIRSLLDQRRRNVRIRGCLREFEKGCCLTLEILPADHCFYPRLPARVDMREAGESFPRCDTK